MLRMDHLRVTGSAAARFYTGRVLLRRYHFEDWIIAISAVSSRIIKNGPTYQALRRGTSPTGPPNSSHRHRLPLHQKRPGSPLGHPEDRRENQRQVLLRPLDLGRHPQPRPTQARSYRPAMPRLFTRPAHALVPLGCREPGHGKPSERDVPFYISVLACASTVGFPN